MCEVRAVLLVTRERIGTRVLCIGMKPTFAQRNKSARTQVNLHTSEPNWACAGRVLSIALATLGGYLRMRDRAQGVLYGLDPYQPTQGLSQLCAQESPKFLQK